MKRNIYIKYQKYIEYWLTKTYPSSKEYDKMLKYCYP